MKTAAAGVAAIVAAVITLAACGGSSHPGQPPTAAAIAHKLGCKVRPWQAGQFAAQDLKQDVMATGGPCGTQAEIYIFPSAAAEKDWLHLAEGPGYSQNEVGPVLAVGHLWAVDPGGVEYDGAGIARRLGGKLVSM